MSVLWRLLRNKRKPLDMVKRRHAWGIAHYGEILPGRQHRLKKKIKSRLKAANIRRRYRLRHGYMMINGEVMEVWQ